MNLVELVQPYTGLLPERIELLINLAQRTLSIPGDMVECGVMNGGSAAVLAYFAAKTADKKTWLFDSFEGMPETTKEDMPSLWGSYREHLVVPCEDDHCKDKSHFGPLIPVEFSAENDVGQCKGSIEKVKEVLSLVGADMNRVKIIKGWFQNTFSTVNIPQIAMLNLDSDWYESEKLCLNKFYDCIVPDGFVYFDDFFFWPGCQKAAREFFKNKGINPVFHQVHHSAWIQKHE